MHQLTPEDKAAYSRQHWEAQALYDYAQKEKESGRLDGISGILGLAYLGIRLAASRDYCEKNGIKI